MTAGSWRTADKKRAISEIQKSQMGRFLSSEGPTKRKQH